ncbi:MAG: septum formation initiator family protein [Polyangia bacterium]
MRFIRVALPVGLLLAALIFLPLKLLDERGLSRVEELSAQLEVLRDKNRRIRWENRALRKEIRAFHSDPQYVEKVARDELGMVGPDEIIYQFPTEPGDQ